MPTRPDWIACMLFTVLCPKPAPGFVVRTGLVCDLGPSLFILSNVVGTVTRDRSFGTPLVLFPVNLPSSELCIFRFLLSSDCCSLESLTLFPDPALGRPAAAAPFMPSL